MDSIIRRVLKDRRKGEQMNTGKNWKDKLWIEQEGAVDWAGAVRWQAGALRLVRATPEFPAGHEFLIFHRPEKVRQSFLSLRTLKNVFIFKFHRDFSLN